MGIPEFASVSISHTYCCWENCDAIIIMPNDVMDQFKNDHEFWHCYRGHSQHFSGKSDKEKLKDKLRMAEKRAEWANEGTRKANDRADRAERSLTATKGHVTRQKKRAAAGVCPCCNRTFKQLARHMKMQHPSYTK